ncbi:class I SAM-dependent methyltransferase [Pseudomonas knackmussii]|uniref:class I SAM-dependent methyltransferase n=1 Tax=Pseudomonas knackmussii TaxID=65741 RepID=UPI003BDBFF70
MKLFELEHSKAAYLADFVLYGILSLVLAAMLVALSPPGLRLQCLLLALLGLLGWTLLEYLLHRFVLHGLQPFRDWHREHHRRPAALIGIPATLSAPLIVLLVFLPALALLDIWRAGALTLGLLVGYLFYSITHHALHHWHGSENRWLSQRRRYHALHHGALAQPGHYGVTSGVWDQLLGSARPEPVRGKPSVAPLPRAASTTPPRSAAGEATTRLLQGLLRHTASDFAIRLWEGSELHFGDAEAPRFTLVCRNPAAVQALVLGRDPLRLVEAYFRGDIDVEGDLFAAIGMKDQLQDSRLSWHQRLSAVLGALLLPNAGATETLHHYRQPAKRHTKQENRAAIAFHYDVSNAFYGLWLDAQMVYSCAYFEQPGDSLELAQRAKLEHICRKLRLQQGERLLDIGCGWGALVIHAVQHHGVYAHGITLSRKQLEMARDRIAQARLEDRVTVELCDYRDLEGVERYDKIASIGMFEHVGLANLPLYFTSVQRLLKPGGLFLNHGITNVSEGWKTTTGTRFINRYIFPDGQLDSIANIQRAMERADFEIHDLEALRRHYGLTLRHWVARLEAHHAQALQYVTEPIYRTWRLYMAASALEFEAGGIGVYQILASRRADGPLQILPLTRQDLYAPPRR